MFHGFSVSSRKWLHKNYVISASFVCNRFSMQMFHCWISNYNCAKSFFIQSVEIDLLRNFITFRFFIILIQRLSLLFLLELLTWVLSQVLLFNLLILSFLRFLSFFFFFTSYYGAMIVTSCGCLYIIFSSMLSLGTNVGVFGRYIIWMFW